MTNENLDLDVKPANKDLWLFLIIVDLILLCVLGFFLYRYFAPRWFSAPVSAVEAEVAEPLPLAEPEAPVSPFAVPEEVEPVVLPTEETVVEEVLAEQAKTQPVSFAADKKQSVTVVKNANSKYRKVTFRWFGEAKNVAVVSGFTMAKPQALKKKDGHWETTLSIAPGTYKFLFVVDGENKRDPYSPEKDGRSLLVVD